MRDDDIEELQRIWALKEKGAISEEEFSRLKSRILDQDSDRAQSEPAEPQSGGPVPGTGVEFRNNTVGVGTGRAVGIGCALLGGLVLILAAIGNSGSSNSGANAMNVDENLTTTDMNATAPETTDLNVTAPASSSDAVSPDTDISSAAAIPVYDTDAYCRKIGDTAGGSYEIEETCRDEESKALAELNSQTIPGRIVHYCSQIGDTAGGSYEIMKTCVEQEENSASRM